MISVETLDSNLVGTYRYYIEAKDQTSGVVNTQAFEVRIQAKDLRIESDQLESVLYSFDPVADPPTTLKLPLPIFSSLTPSFLTYELVLVSFVPLTGLRRL